MADALLHIGFIFLIIDSDGDVACATTTEVEAEQVVEKAQQDGNTGYRIEKCYLYGLEAGRGEKED